MQSLRGDFHIHTLNWYAPFGAQPSLRTAEARGIDQLGCVEHVTRDTEWVARFVAGAKCIQRRTRIELILGVEAEVLDSQGTLDLPDALGDIQRVFVADHYLPIGGVRLLPHQARMLVSEGVIGQMELVDGVVSSLAKAIRRAPRQVVLSHPFAGLVESGIPIDTVPLHHFAPIVDALLDRNGLVELNEERRAPTRALLGYFSDCGLGLLPGTDALIDDEVGRFDYVAGCLSNLNRVAA